MAAIIFLKLLRQSGACLNNSAEYEESPLMVLCFNTAANTYHKMKLLLEAGVNVSAAVIENVNILSVCISSCAGRNRTMG